MEKPGLHAQLKKPALHFLEPKNRTYGTFFNDGMTAHFPLTESMPVSQ